MTAVVWLQGSLSDAKAVSGNTFICPHFLLPSLWIHHPSVALFLQHFFFLRVSQEISITEKSAVQQFTWHAWKDYKRAKKERKGEKKFRGKESCFLHMSFASG